VRNNCWNYVKLSTITTKIGSGVTPRGGQSAYKNSGIPLIRSQNVHINRFELKGLVYISAEQDERMKNSRVFPGDVLLNITGASIGRVCVVPDEMCPANVNQHVSIIRCNEHIDSEFLAFYLANPDFQKFIFESQSGATRQALTKTMIEAFEIPLPPLKEQKRIVAILNTNMADFSRARAAAEQQLKTAQLLLNAYIKSVFEHGKYNGWSNPKLGEICEFIGGSQPPKHKFSNTYKPGYVRLVQIQDFRKSNVAVYIPKEDSKRRFTKDDVMIGRYGPPVFQILRGLSGAYNVALMRANPKQNLLSKDFLFYLLKEEGIQNAVISQSQRAAGQSGINKQFLESYEVWLPLKEQQDIIVQRLNKISDATTKLFRILQGRLKDIEALPASLIKKAFMGKL